MKQLTLTAAEVAVLLLGQPTLLLRVCESEDIAVFDRFEAPDLVLAICGDKAALRAEFIAKRCPLGRVGNALYGAEAWIEFHCSCLDCQPCRMFEKRKSERKVWYGANGECEPREGAWMSEPRAPITMNVWASRFSLQVREVRALQAKTLDSRDALATGAPAFDGCDFPDPVGALIERFDAQHGAGAFAANPWLWAIKVEVVP